MDISDFIPHYYNTSDEEFYQSIYSKKEFYDLTLEREEKPPSDEGRLLYKHQLIISRFLSSNTLYDGILLDHAMGTGKSCTAFGAIEQIRSENSTIRKALILARGPGNVNNLINELVFKCSEPGKYVPERYNVLTEIEKKRRIKKLLSPFYSFDTFETFAKELKRLSDSDVEEKYSNTVIVIDEVHNLGESTYRQFWRLMHLATNSKKILMSGTPMKDSPTEIAPVLNLLLPENKQLPTGKAFIARFLEELGKDRYKVKNKSELKEYMRGIVSYLRPMESTVKTVFEGRTMGELNHLIVYPENMSKFQSDSYREAFRTDAESGARDKTGVYSNSRQASLFVFPSGKWGEEGFKTAFDIREQKSKVTGRAMRTQTMTKDFARLFTGSDLEKLGEIEKFSSCYASTIRDIIDPKNKDKIFFVYNEYVQGSGAILFSKLLEQFGFARSMGREANKGKRYTILTNLTAGQVDIERAIRKLSAPENMYGEYIKVIIGSGVISEGFTLKNVQRIHIQTPHWNYSEIAQAITRGIRLGSHNDLIRAGINPVVNIFQHVSIPINAPSIDLIMYERSESKDISIKQIERLIKESAVDCALTYNRNYVSGKAGLRECDYESCEYTCDGIEKGFRPEENLDLQTYNLYYNSPKVKEIISELLNLYKTEFGFSLTQLRAKFKNNNLFEILTALRTMINEYIPIKNKYGLISYLKDDRDMYFLVDKLMGSAQFFTETYTETPDLSAGMTYKEAVNDFYVESIRDVKSYDEFVTLAKNLPDYIAVEFIKGAVLAKNLNKVGELSSYILKFYNPGENSIRLGKYNLTLSETGEWVETVVERVEVNKESKYYGTYDSVQDKFSIVNNTMLPGETADNRLKKPGMLCANWHIDSLLDVVMYFKLPYANDVKIKAKMVKIGELSDSQLEDLLLSNNYVKNYIASLLK